MNNYVESFNIAAIVAAVAGRPMRWAVTLALTFALLSGSVFEAVHADVSQTQWIPNHTYVYYNAANVPSTSGTLVDDTYGFNDGHVTDIYGNVMTVQPNNQITDSNNQVVGFLYTASSQFVTPFIQ